MSDEAAVARTANEAAISVMLVDDSSIIRGLMSRALRSDPRIDVVATAANGEMALSVVKQCPVDVIVLDIEMPKMDGMSALPKLLDLSPDSKVIMASTLTVRNANISMRALDMGAADYIPKPSAKDDSEAVEAFYRELRDKVVALGRSAQKTMPATGSVRAARANQLDKKLKGPFVTRGQGMSRAAKAIAIASSTGGPQALAAVLIDLNAQLAKVPVFVTQHMPRQFTALLAQHLTKDTGCECIEAEDGMIAQAGKIYFAPGDYHMLPKAKDGVVKIKLNQDPPVNYCRPAADPMLRALAEIYKDTLLTVVLTGMGQDGLRGAEEVVNKGGVVIAQDEATSVVWGMPGAVANAGLCDCVLPLDVISSYIKKALEG